MNKKQIELKYDRFFGEGLWEREYKPHITVFAEQCVRESDDSGNSWLSCSDRLPEIGQPVIAQTHSGQIHYAIYSEDDEFDVHVPAGSDKYRKKWYKYSCRTVINWKPI